MPKLFVGIGNPGLRYDQTRHNAGFWLADALAQQARVGFAHKRKFNADIATVDGIHLLKPQTWMNNSGVAVRTAAAFYGVSAADIIVAHDEVDLPVGKVKLKCGGGNAGHNGLASISRELNDNGYWRLRIGVGKPPVGGIHDYVLAAPKEEDMQQIKTVINTILGVWQDLTADNYDRAMLVLHTVKL